VNKEKFLKSVELAHIEKMKTLKKWIDEEIAEYTKICDFIGRAPDDMPDPIVVGGSISGIYLRYPLDHNIMLKVMRCMANISIDGCRAKPSVLCIDASTAHRSYSFVEEGKVNALLTVTVRFENSVEGSTCKLVKVSEREIKRMEPIYKVDCGSKKINAEIAAAMVNVEDADES